MTCHATEPGIDPVAVPPVSDDVGEKLREWLSSPFDLAAFGPRLTVGALLSAPERIQTFGSELERVSELMNSPAPAEDKSKLLAGELEKYAPVHHAIQHANAGEFIAVYHAALRAMLRLCLAAYPCALPRLCKQHRPGYRG